MGFFDDDYCFCGNSDSCPLKDQCKRADHKPGIHSYANFYSEDKDCEYFYLKEKKNEE